MGGSRAVATVDMVKLTATQARLFLDRNIGVVATIRADGSPHVTPVWVDWDGEAVLINTASPIKQAHLRRDPRIAIAVFDRNEPERYVEVRGAAQVSAEGAWEHADRLVRRYRGLDRMPRRTDQHRVVIRVRPEHVVSQGC
jgi:PPOX class probable F420-dependent enzyme